MISNFRFPGHKYGPGKISSSDVDFLLCHFAFDVMHGEEEKRPFRFKKRRCEWTKWVFVLFKEFCLPLNL